METVIFVKCRDFTKMPCFVVFLDKVLCFFPFYKTLTSTSWSLSYDFNTKLFIFASYIKFCVLLCYFLAQYV